MIKLLAWIILLFPGPLRASTDAAGRAAERAWGVMGGPSARLKTQLVEEAVIPFGKAGSDSAFVVTFRPAGFVIVSVGSRTTRVLGYSLESAFPSDPAHPLRSWLLPEYARNLSAGLKDGQTIQYTTDQMVLPLVTAHWGQGDPWNRLCPADTSGKRALAGCVAVAMAQIMDKWQWPERGFGSVSYTPPLHPEYGKLTVDFDSTRYDWDDAHPVYPTETAEKVLYHVGVASYMNYDPVNSSTSIDIYALPALADHFFYNSGMVFRAMDSYDVTDWIRLLHQELDNSRPVLYSGTSPDGRSSHAFNIDGYRDDRYFHFNWGWNGAGDGWFSLDGMAGGGSDYSHQQGAVFGLQPANIPLRDRPSCLDLMPGDGFVQLFWQPPLLADFSHFNIYRNDTLINQTTKPGYRDTLTENGRRFTYRISAYYVGMNSGESESTDSLGTVPWVRFGPDSVQNFEKGEAGWLIRGNPSGFQIGRAANFGIDGNNGMVAFIRSEGHPAGDQVDDFLTSPAVYPADYAQMAITFDYLFRQNPGTDRLSLVWRSYSDGKWQTLAELDSTGGYGDWKTAWFYLPRPAGNDPIQVAFHYDDGFGQGYGAAIDNIRFYEVPEKTVPEFGVSDSDLCLDQMATVTDLSTGPATIWEWDFGAGAVPRYANTKGPHEVYYSTPGTKTISLTVNHLDHIRMENRVSVRKKPIAGFEYYRQYMDIHFTNRATDAERVVWLFGDGTTSAETDPVHAYHSKELFEVSQIAFNGPCHPDTLTVYIDMRSGTGIDEKAALQSISIFPNPTSGTLTLLNNSSSGNGLNVKILSMTGQLFLNRDFASPPDLTLDLSPFPDGLYILRITTGVLVRNEQIVKIKH